MNPAVPFPLRANVFPVRFPVIEKSRRVPAEAIRNQLARILQSAGFVNAGRMRRFLRFVVEETLAGRAHELCEYSVGISVFDRSATFEPGMDPIVRNDARRLRQKLLEYYQGSCWPGGDPVRIQIPKGGYVPTFSKFDAQPPRAGKQYRLTMSLTRIADGTEIWSTEEDVYGG